MNMAHEGSRVLSRKTPSSDTHSVTSSNVDAALHLSDSALQLRADRSLRCRATHARAHVVTTVLPHKQWTKLPSCDRVKERLAYLKA